MAGMNLPPLSAIRYRLQPVINASICVCVLLRSSKEIKLIVKRALDLIDGIEFKGKFIRGIEH